MEQPNLNNLGEKPSTLEQMVDGNQSRKSLRIGVPKESAKLEHRVSLTPETVEILVKSGAEVVVEQGAGAAAGYTDEAYFNSGAKVVTNAADAFRCNIVVKVAFPEVEEVNLMNNDGLIVANVYCDSPQAVAAMKRMAEKKLTAIAFEWITDNSGHAPIQKALEQIAGKMAILVASGLLSTWHGGKGLLLCSVPGIEPLKLVVLGSGVIADAAAKTATSLGISVTVLGPAPSKLGELGKIPITGMLYSGSIVKHLEAADVVIGAVDPMKDEYFKIDDELVKRMKKGAIIVDILAGKGGCFNSTVSQPLETPVYEKHGVRHFCVPNITSLTAHTTSKAISSMLLPVLLKLMRVGSVIQVLKEEPGVCDGTYLFKGLYTNTFIAKQHQASAQNIIVLLKTL